MNEKYLSIEQHCSIMNRSSTSASIYLLRVEIEREEHSEVTENLTTLPCLRETRKKSRKRKVWESTSYIIFGDFI